jgi:hypothetical protein
MLTPLTLTLTLTLEAPTRMPYAEDGYGNASRSQANMLFVHPIRSLRKRNRSQHEQVLGMYGMCDEDDAI